MNPEINPVEKMILALARHPLGLSPVVFLSCRKGFPLLLFLLRHRYVCLNRQYHITLSMKGKAIAKRLSHPSAADMPVRISIPQPEQFIGEDYDACV